MQELIDTLQSIADGNTTPNTGLCIYMLEKVTPCEHSIFKNAMYSTMRKWKHYSCDIRFPIAHPSLQPSAAFHAGNLYEGEYGRRRRELAGLIAEELRKCPTSIK